jgi:hypothetical protein
MGGAAAWWSAACERKGGDGYYLESPRNGRVTWAWGGGMPDRPTAGPHCRTAAATAAAREQQAAAAARAGTARADRRADSQQSATWWWSGHAAAMRRRLHMTVGHRGTDTSHQDRTGAHAPPPPWSSVSRVSCNGRVEAPCDPHHHQPRCASPPASPPREVGWGLPVL